jgi:hypothetical protein
MNQAYISPCGHNAATLVPASRGDFFVYSACVPKVSH